MTIAEVRDAIGEVTNIVAGNLRTAMPEGAHMSLPTVVDGVGFSFEIIDAKLQVDLAFEFQGEAFRLSIWTNGSPPS
jgi:CheY-specific phosphatase CheX